MKPIFRIPLLNGLIAGGLGTLFVIGLYYLNRHPLLIPVYLDFRIFLIGVFIFFTLKELRDVYYGGIFYFWQGTIASFIFISSFTMVASFGIFVFGNLVPDFLSSYIKLEIDLIRHLPAEVTERIGKDVVERNLKLLPATNVSDLAVLYLSQSYLIGLPLSIILSVILRRQPKT
jgi:hypothetical protein